MDNYGWFKNHPKYQVTHWVVELQGKTHHTIRLEVFFLASVRHISIITIHRVCMLYLHPTNWGEIHDKKGTLIRSREYSKYARKKHSEKIGSTIRTMGSALFAPGFMDGLILIFQIWRNLNASLETGYVDQD